ncbi:protein asteroid [Hetaerina americana]|uniref:protein asteroid n=1 Tax=Hetaerina americana TaxID=62018 RepID=UPI003A7F5082
MGIRGLTTFIAQNHDQSFVPYRLHNCSLVIDGNSIAAQIYVREFGKGKSRHCAFGGDYDEYARSVKRFFILLSCCEVKPIVIFDGGKEPRKASTSLARLKGNILRTGNVRPDSFSDCPLPLLMLEVFKWVAVRSGATIGVCDFEADEELAALARGLSCPLLSFDSDFYIHAVPTYIPFPMLATELTEEGLTLDENGRGETVLRYLECSAFSVNKFLNRSDIGDWRKKSRGTKHILQVEVLPLVAALLGNDYVKPKTFRHFLSKIATPKSKCRNHRQRAIVGLLEWLRLEESLESAIKKILSHTKKGRRDHLEKIIQQTVSVYVGCPSELLHQLNLSIPLSPEVKSVDTKGDVAESTFTLMPTVKEEYDEIERSQMENMGTSDKINYCEKMEVESLIQNSANILDNGDLSSTEEDDDYSDSEGEQGSDCAINDQDVSWNERKSQIPIWFLERFRKFHLPPSFMDILMHRFYICPPQVEDQSRPHSHAISFPILSAIVRLLTPSIETPLVCWTRVDRHAAALNLDPLPKNSSWPAPEALLVTPLCSRIQILLQSLNLIDDHEEKNTLRKLYLESLPSDWRLLALSLAYWRRNSSLHKEDESFLIAACFCIVVLRVIDVRAGPPGRKSRKVRKDKNKLQMMQAVEMPEAKLLEGNEDFDGQLKQENDNYVNGSFPGGVAGKAQGELENRQKSIKEILQLVSAADCLRVSASDGKLNQLRQVDNDSGRGAFLRGRYPGHKRARQFNLATVHCFSEFQSLILHVGYLNSLLGEPFVSNVPHASFSGTIAYNAHCEINGKSSSDQLKKSLWEILLGTSAPSLENLMDEFLKCVLSLAWGVNTQLCVQSCDKKKTKRKRKNKRKDIEENNRNVTETSDKESEETLIDPENKYSLLNLIEIKR